MENKECKFSNICAAFWPIHNHESKKFIPLVLLLCCALLNYVILRDTKDTLIVYAGGATIIPIVKGVGTTLAILFFSIVYMVLTFVLTREKIFYVLVSPLIIYFAVFGFILYPNVDFYHPAKETILTLKANHPQLSMLFDLYEYWTYSVFYVCAEI